MDAGFQTNLRDLNDHREDVSSFARSSRRDVTPKTAAARVDFGSGWYHDAAIDEARRAEIEARCNPYA